MSSTFEDEIAAENTADLELHGETIAYTPATTAVEVSITAIVDRSSKQMVPVEDGQKSVRIMTIYIQTSDVATRTEGEDKATIDSQTWALMEEGPTLGGMVELTMRATAQREYHMEGHRRTRT